MESKTKKPFHWKDYEDLARTYNLLEKGRSMEAGEVSNITDFKRTISRRGVVLNKDFKAYTKKGRTYLKRLSHTVMREM